MYLPTYLLTCLTYFSGKSLLIHIYAVFFSFFVLSLPPSISLGPLLPLFVSFSLSPSFSLRPGNVLSLGSCGDQALHSLFLPRNLLLPAVSHHTCSSLACLILLRLLLHFSHLETMFFIYCTPQRVPLVWGHMQFSWFQLAINLGPF